MAKAIIKGAIEGDVIQGDQIAVADPEKSSREYFAEFGCLTFEKVDQLPESKYLLLAVKPQIFEEIALEVKSDVVYSIMAGVTTKQITNRVGDSRIVRIMPNLPCSIGFGATGLALGATATKEDSLLATELFSAIGIVVDVEESLMDAVTAVSGSGPAYVFMLAEAMIMGGVEAGLSVEDATALTKQTVLGASHLLAQDDRCAGELREAVTSKGGTTSAALELLNERNVTRVISDAVVAARDRGRELGT